MVEASLTETRPLSNYRQTRTFNPMLPEYVSQDWQDIAVFCDESGQVSQSEFGKAWMIIQAPALRPVKFSIRLGYRQIVDAGEPIAHQAVWFDFPIFVPARAKPVSAVAVPFVSKRDLGRIAAISTIFGQTHFLYRGRAVE